MACRCQGCGDHYKIDIIVPNIIWEKIKPPWTTKGGGLLCGKCIIERISDLEKYGSWQLMRLWN